MEKEELNECLTMFYAAVRQEDGTEFKVLSLKAIRAAVNRYLRVDSRRRYLQTNDAGGESWADPS